MQDGCRTICNPLDEDSSNPRLLHVNVTAVTGNCDLSDSLSCAPAGLSLFRLRNGHGHIARRSPLCGGMSPRRVRLDNGTATTAAQGVALSIQPVADDRAGDLPDRGVLGFAARRSLSLRFSRRGPPPQRLRPATEQSLAARDLQEQRERGAKGARQG